jgi:excisionase family DNA binding protein
MSAISAPAPDEGPRFLTLEKASMRSGLSNSTLRREIRRGRLQAYRPAGRRVLIAVAELDQFITGGRQ